MKKENNEKISLLKFTAKSEFRTVKSRFYGINWFSIVFSINGWFIRLPMIYN